MGHAGRVKRRVCVVTGTRAEFGLLRPVLDAIRAHERLTLQLLVTGMHLDRRHGHSIDQIRDNGYAIDSIVPWSSRFQLAQATALASAKMATAFEQLQCDIVLVVGDRVEAFAAASAAHLSGKLVAHIHGGDRALGQVDDALRHAITKLAHLHFPATAASAERLLKLGEDRFRIHRCGSPGVEGIRQLSQPRRDLKRLFPMLTAGQFALVVLHPVEAATDVEFKRAISVLKAVRLTGISQVAVIYPNNDPGADGIIRAWQTKRGVIDVLLPNADRAMFLGLLRDCAVLVGNSSSGIIEAASFGTNVLDIGPRQEGRERSGNVVHTSYALSAMRAALRQIWNNGKPRCFTGGNVYGGNGVGKRIANALASENVYSRRMRRKLIAY